MEKNKTIAKNRRIRSKVKSTATYGALSKAKQMIANTGQKITAIFKSLETVKAIGIKNWELISQNSAVNAEIVRELYINSLDVKF